MTKQPEETVEAKLGRELDETKAVLAVAKELLRDWRYQSGRDAFFLTREPGPRARGEALMERTDEFLGTTPSGEARGRRAE